MSVEFTDVMLVLISVKLTVIVWQLQRLRYHDERAKGRSE